MVSFDTNILDSPSLMNTSAAADRRASVAPVVVLCRDTFMASCGGLTQQRA